MNAEIFAATVSALLFGFAVGMSLKGLIVLGDIQKLNDSLQSAIDTMFNKDKTIDKLNDDLDDMRSRYVKLYEATETSRRALDSVRNLPPPPFPITRCENYVDDCLPRIPDFPNPATPICEPSSTD